MAERRLTVLGGRALAYDMQSKIAGVREEPGMEEMRLADERLNVLEHPLIAHKMSIMRDASTAPSQFRQLVHEVAMLEVYEASRDLATEPVEVETPLQRAVGKRIAGEKLAVVPILRAGM